MTSSKFILIFLGFIFVVVVLLTSNRIAGALRDRFGKLIPPLSFLSAADTTPTPVPSPTVYVSRFPTGTASSGTTTTKGGLVNTPEAKSTPTGETPATGPETFIYLLLGGSFLAGSLLKKQSKNV